MDRQQPEAPETGSVEQSTRLFCKVLLPDRVDWSRAAMSLANGILEIEVPKLGNNLNIHDMI